MEGKGMMQYNPLVSKAEGESKLPSYFTGRYYIRNITGCVFRKILKE